MGILTGKRALVTGLLSNKSIAAGISEKLHAQGAELAFTYVNDKLKARVEKLAAPYQPAAILPLDVASDDQINNVFEQLSKVWDGIDIIIHAIAFAPADQLCGNFIDNVNREGFQMAHDISAYSLCALAKAARPMMQNRDGSIVALTYLGAEKCVANYNTMGLAKASLEAGIRYSAQALGPQGIRVNGISAGPIRTLAASGIKGFRKMLDHNQKVAPLGRNVTIEEVGDVAAFLASDMSRAITGEIIHVDCGFSTVAVPQLNEDDD